MGGTKNITVPLLDLKAQFRDIKDPIMQAIEEVCDSQWFIMGPNVSALEAQVAEYSQCEHGVGVSSGTDALLVALMALDVGPGTAVITTPFTFFATGGTIARLGATPIFCDIDAETYNIDAGLLETLISTDCDTDAGKLVHKKTGDVVKVIMPVHLFGQTADMDALNAIASRYGLAVVEDAAQSIGSEYTDGRRAGSLGNIGCFSFFPSKNLGAFGDGGMCTTNDAELAEKMRVLRMHGGKPKYYHATIGGNFRLDALQAAILLVKLSKLDEWHAGRQANADFYNREFEAAGLNEHISRPKLLTGRRHIYNQYIIRGKRRDELREHLGQCNIGTEIYYPVALHQQKCFAYLGYQEGDCRESENAANETLAIPIYPELSDEQKSYIVRCIAEFYS